MRDQCTKAVTLRRLCHSCAEHSPRVYQEAWMCLHSRCPKFWVPGNGSPVPDHLSYMPCFFDRVATPELSEETLRALTKHDTRKPLMRGQYCSECGFASIRSATALHKPKTPFHHMLDRARWDCWQCQECGVSAYPVAFPVRFELFDLHRNRSGEHRQTHVSCRS